VVAKVRPAGVRHFRYSCVTSWRCRGDDNWVLPAVGVVRV
jgi:hypothetical protein